MKTFTRIVFGLLRIWLGYTWFTASLEKIGNPVWTGDKAGVAISGFFQGALAKAAGEHPSVQGWYASFIHGVALPNAKFFSYLIPTGEFLVGLALILGAFTTFAAVMGALMNLNFMLAGTTSTNPILYTVAIIIIVAGVARVGYYGVDYFLMPYVRPILGRLGLKWGQREATASAR